jgi:Ni,Fe-hydrogenase III large subunit
MNAPWLSLANGTAAAQAALPCWELPRLHEAVLEAVAAGARLGSWSVDGEGRLLAVLVDDAGGRLLLASAQIGQSVPALSPRCAQAQRFEREMAEEQGVVAEGHPWWKPLRFHQRWTPGPDAWERTGAQLPGTAPVWRLEGPAVHEVAVGPVHAGVIEPGHFRFQCLGEVVHHLEIQLGFQHRGVLRAQLGGPHARSLAMMETLAGDSSIAHAWAHCALREALGGIDVSPLATQLRALMLELERLANHTGDLGALGGDVGFQPTAAFNGRIRGDFLNLSALVCGNRLGRGLLRPGGVRFDLDAARSARLRSGCRAAGRDVTRSVRLLLSTSAVQARFEGVGRVRSEDARQLGLVGLAARACGLAHDARCDLTLGAAARPPAPAVASTGDVHARAVVRWQEIESSLRLVEELLDQLPAQTGPLLQPVPALRPLQVAVAVIEGWRGPVLHVAETDAAGRFLRYRAVDPSFHNWAGLELALRGEQISDFPLCNKSFNLSYCGHDQ